MGRTPKDGQPRRRRNPMPYVTSEMTSVLQRLAKSEEYADLAESVYFTPTAMTFMRRLVADHGTVVADSSLTQNAVDRLRLVVNGMQLACYLDDPLVRSTAERRRVTRAEVAVEHALSLPGAKLFVIGSAPQAIRRLVECHEASPLHDVGVVAGPTGFAAVLQLKEQLWDSGLPAVLIRGRKGGVQETGAVFNALLAETIRSRA